MLSWFVWYGWRTGRVQWLWVIAAAALMLGFRMARYGNELYKNHYPARYIQYYVPATGLYAAALIASWWKNSRGKVMWKGRTYPAGTRTSS